LGTPWVKKSIESNLSYNNLKQITMNLHPKKLFPEVENLELLNHQPITKRDLLNFSNIILTEIKEIVGLKEQPTQWLKSSEVRKLLKISPGTLQNLRVNGTLNYNRIGGILYYKYDDIAKMLNQ
jgi:hypothetical protein